MLIANKDDSYEVQALLIANGGAFEKAAKGRKNDAARGLKIDAVTRNFDKVRKYSSLKRLSKTMIF